MNQLTLPPDLLDDLQRVEDLIIQRTASHSAIISVAGRHVLNSGGKRLRALLALLSARLGVYNFDQAVHVATTAELIHTASLVHDDLVDEAERRRGSMTVHQRWDHGVALMVGDYFFALAAGEMALAPDTRIITYFSQAVMTICEGELSPVMHVTPFDIARDQYYHKIGCKTASLFEAACRSGAVAGRLHPEQVAVLGDFGYDLGLAFQIVDDMLDFVGSGDILGKPAGSDLRQGVITLPLIYAVEQSGSQALAESIDSDDTQVVEWAIEEVRRLGIEPTREEAYGVVDRALSRLAIFPETATTHVIKEIARFVLERDV